MLYYHKSMIKWRRFLSVIENSFEASVLCNKHMDLESVGKACYAIHRQSLPIIFYLENFLSMVKACLSLVINHALNFFCYACGKFKHMIIKLVVNYCAQQLQTFSTICTQWKLHSTSTVFFAHFWPQASLSTSVSCVFFPICSSKLSSFSVWLLP